jgi:hypothetical protein
MKPDVSTLRKPDILTLQRHLSHYPLTDEHLRRIIAPFLSYAVYGTVGSRRRVEKPHSKYEHVRPCNVLGLASML